MRKGYSQNADSLFELSKTGRRLIAAEGAAGGILAFGCRRAGDPDLGSITFAVFVVNTVVRLAVYMNGPAATSFGVAVILSGSFSETFTAGFVSSMCVLAAHHDVSF